MALPIEKMKIIHQAIASAIRQVDGVEIADLKPDLSPVPTQRPLYDVTTQAQAQVLDAFGELKRHLQARNQFLPTCLNHQPTEAESRFLDLNFWLTHNQTVDTEWAGATLLPDSFATQFQETACHLRKRYSESLSSQSTYQVETAFTHRFKALYWWIWLSAIALNVEHVNEFKHWTELLEVSCCPIQLENVSLCIRLLAGQQAEDRDGYLAKLRPYFTRNLERIQGKQTLTCDCSEGISDA